MNFDGNTFGNGAGKMPTHTPAMILCCLCGVKIESNPANMCAQCLQSQVDITEGIPKQITIFWCRNCGRYQRPPWIDAPLESREMLALCLKKIKNLNKEVKLVDAAFIWTEPHSRRIKVKLTVQKEIFNSIIMQQVFVVEYIVGNMQCPDCQRSFTEHTWTACVQVRQHRKHKRTIFYLEQLLMKHNICANVIQIKEVTDGLDFYWNTKNQATHMIEFLRSVLPIRQNLGKKLISQDDNNNTMKYKYNYMIEIAQTSKEDLVAISHKLCQQLGGASPLMLCHRVSNTIHLVDPISLKTAELNAERYFLDNPRVVLTPEQMTEFTILDIEPVEDNQYSHGLNPKNLQAFNKQNAYNAKICLAEATVARTSDLGVNDITFTILTHLGNILKAGDTCRGYDLVKQNITEDVVSKMKGRELPDIILVRKTFPKFKKRAERRPWKLKLLNKEVSDKVPKKFEIEKAEMEYERFMQDIEEDPELRSKVNLYRRYDTEAEQQKLTDRFKHLNDDDDLDAADLPEIKLDELLDDLQKVTLEYKDDDGMDIDPSAVDEDLAYGGDILTPQVKVESGRAIRNEKLNAPDRFGGFGDEQ